MSKFSDLGPAAQQLIAATDELTKTLEVIQGKINAYGLNVEVWLNDSVHYELDRVVTGIGGIGGRGERTVRIQELGYGRIGDGWALLVRSIDYEERREIGEDWEFSDADPVEVDRKPLVKATRPVRALAIELIPQLIDRLRAAAMEIVAAVAKAKKIADSLE